MTSHQKGIADETLVELLTLRTATLRFALLESVATSLFHAVSNTTNVIVGHAGMLEMKRPGDSDVTQAIHEIRTQVDRLSELSRSVRSFVSRSLPEVEVESCARELELVVAFLHRTAEDRGVGICAVATEPVVRPVLRADSLHAMLFGVLGFAVLAAPPGSVVDAALGPSPGSLLTLRVTLPPDSRVPSSRRDITAPWLTDTASDAEARLLLAVGIGSAEERGGSFELAPLEGSLMLAVSLPLSGRSKQEP